MLTWVDVDLDALRHNFRQLQTLTGTRVAPVVKANAYGHGLAPVARALAMTGTDYFCVARADEGLVLRDAGVEAEVLVLGYTPPEQALEAIGRGLTLAAFDADSIAAYATAARATNRKARLHLKLDTGMTRLGALPTDAANLARRILDEPALELDGLFQHFAASDSTDKASARGQLNRFNDVLAALPVRPRIVHACNSAGALTLPEARFDLVRTGIAFYGLDPSDEVPVPPDFRPALAWKAKVSLVKSVPAGTGVSYDHQYVTTTPETLAIVPVGYADGYRRKLGINEVLIGGLRAPVRGRVCMDQVIVGVTHIPNVAVGDEVVVLGPQGADALTAEELARRWGTNNYDVVAGILARVPRRYRD